MMEPSTPPPFGLAVMLVEKSLAALVLLVCVLALVRGAVGVRQRQRWDQAVQRATTSLRHTGQRLAQGWRQWRVRRGAAQEAQDVIERARRAGTKAAPPKEDDNVIRPAAFDRKQRRGDKLH